MPTSSIQRALVPAACVAGAVFAASTAPLALYRTEVVEVAIQNQPLFAAEMRDLAGPYLGLAGIVSVSVGASIMGFSGWRQAARKTQAAESKLTGLQRDLLAQQMALEEIKFSDARLRAQQLNAFLEVQPASDSSLPQQRVPIAAVPQPTTVPLAAAAADPAPKAQAVAVSGREEMLPTSYQTHYTVPPQPQAVPADAMKDKATMALSAAQSYASYVRSNGAPELAAPVEAHAPQGAQLDQLLLQLRDLASQVEELRTGSPESLAA